MSAGTQGQSTWSFPIFCATLSFCGNCYYSLDIAPPLLSTDLIYAVHTTPHPVMFVWLVGFCPSPSALPSWFELHGPLSPSLLLSFSHAALSLVRPSQKQV